MTVSQAMEQVDDVAVLQEQEVHCSECMEEQMA